MLKLDRRVRQVTTTIKCSFAQMRKLPDMLYNPIGRMIMRASALQFSCRAEVIFCELPIVS